MKKCSEIGNPRFELGLTESESVVLPLHQSPNKSCSVNSQSSRTFRAFLSSFYGGKSNALWKLNHNDAFVGALFVVALRPKSWDTKMPASMSAHPQYSRLLRRSEIRIAPAIAANGLSMLNKIAACVGGAVRCPTTCNVNATATASAPKYTSDIHALETCDHSGSPWRIMKTKATTPVTRNCTAASSIGSQRGA